MLEKLLSASVREVETLLNVRLDPKDVTERGKEALVVFVHGLLHAAIAKLLPELADSANHKVDAANELFVRILEDEISRNLDLSRHSPEEHVAELSHAFPGLRVAPWEYAELARLWREEFAPKRDIAGFSHHLISWASQRFGW